MASDDNNGWNIDRHIPVASIGVILVQTAGIAWWAASMSARVDQLEKQAITAAPQAERLIKVETKMDALVDAIKDIQGFLRDRLPRQPVREP